MKPLMQASLILALLVVAVGAQDPTQASDAATLIPANTMAVVYIPSLDGTEGKLKSLVSAIDPDSAEMIDASQHMAMMGLEMPPDRKRPVLLAILTPPDAESEPSFVAIVPYTDVKAAAESIAAIGMEAEPVVRGNYIAFCPMGSFTAGTMPHRLMTGLPEGDAVIRVDLEAAMKVWGPKVREGLDVMDEQMEEAAAKPDMAGMEEWFASIGRLTRDFAESAQMLDITLGIDGGRAELALSLHVKEGSALAKGDFMKGSDLRPFTRTIPAHHPLAMAMSLDLAGMFRKFLPLYEEMATSMGEEQGAAFKEMMAKTRDMMSGMGPEFSLSMGASAKGFEVTEAFGAKDPERLVASMRDLMASDLYRDMGFTATMTEPKEAEGTMRRSMTVSGDWGAFAGASNPNVSAEDMTRLMSVLFGGDTLKVDIATRANQVLFTHGANVMDVALAGNSQSLLNGVLSKAGPSPTFVMALDVRTALQQARELAASMGMADEIPPIGKGPAAPVGMYLSRQGRTFRYGVMADVKAVFDVLKPLMR